MSAICGVLGGRPGANPSPDVGAMLDALADYGAGRAEWSDGPVRLGRRCRRDAGDGAPPQERPSPEPAARIHHCREAGLALAADARLDDREALRDALGCREAGVCDGELILRAWRRWGPGCPNHLLGDYAFALWDARRRTLFCARDHIGVRPFYYARAGERFVFASAVPAVLAAPGVSDRLDDDFVAAHLTHIGLDTTTHTFFSAVRKLPPGHTLTVTGEGRLRTERYWRPEDVPRVRPASDDACAQECLDLCARAVRDRLRGSGPVGAHLSGGLDSSGVAALAARELRRQGRAAPLAFTWLPDLGGGAPKPEHAPEYALVDAVARQERLRTLHCGLGPGDVLALLRRDGALPGVHFHINEEAVQRRAEALGVRVLLSGWGGDQSVSFSGFRGWPEHLLLTGRWLELTAYLRRSHEGRSFRASGPGRAGARASGAPSRHQRVAAGPAAAGQCAGRSALAHRPRVPAAGKALRRGCLSADRSAAHVVAAPAQRVSERAHGGLGGERRGPGHRIPLPAAGPPGAGVRSWGCPPSSSGTASWAVG